MEVNVTCLCSAAKQTVKFKADSFPIAEEICHCNPCRHSTGSMGGIFLSLSSPPPDLSAFTSYKTSDKLERLFCKTCGSHVFVHVFGRDSWSVGAGCVDVEGKTDDVAKVVEHAYVGDTKDGGWAGFLLNINGREIPCYDQDARDEAKKITVEPAPVGPTPLKEGEDRLLVNCHCGGAKSYLHRSETPFSDAEGMAGTWWLLCGGKKYRAGMCPCRSCRLWLGQPLQPWMFCEENDVRDADGKPVNFEENWGTLKTYESSPGTFRHFCSTCGASVFYRDKGRAKMVGKEVIDISIGVLRAEEGVRAENWLEWQWTRMGYKDHGLEKELINHLLSLAKA